MNDSKDSAHNIENYQLKKKILDYIFYGDESGLSDFIEKSPLMPINNTETLIAVLVNQLISFIPAMESNISESKRVMHLINILIDNINNAPFETIH